MECNSNQLGLDNAVAPAATPPPPPAAPQAPPVCGCLERLWCGGLYTQMVRRALGSAIEAINAFVRGPGTKNKRSLAVVAAVAVAVAA